MNILTKAICAITLLMALWNFNILCFCVPVNHSIDTSKSALHNNNNIFLLLDSHGQETNAASTNHALVSQLIGLLDVKCTPIITTTNLLHNVYHFNKIKNMDTVDKEWEFYHHKEAGLVLLLPKQFIIENTSTIDSTYSNLQSHAQEYGFDFSMLEKVDSSSKDSVIAYIKNTKKNFLYNQPKLACHIASMFKSIDKNFANISDDTIPHWNVVLSGHGCRLDYEKLLSDGNHAEKGLSKILSKEPARSIIAGIGVNELNELVSFLNSTIKTSAFFYTACYTGGNNLTVVNELLSNTHVSFIAATRGLSNTAHSGIKTNNMDLFFKKIKKIHILSDEEQKTIFAESINFIVNNDYLCSESLLLNSVFIRTPSAHGFEPIENQRRSYERPVKTKVLTKDKRYNVNAIINYNDPYDQSIIDGLFIDVPYIKQPLHVTSKTNIISLPPHLFSESQNKQHIFEEMICHATLPQVVSNFLFYNRDLSKTSFIIKKLRCFEAGAIYFSEDEPSKVFHNVVINLIGKSVSSSWDSAIDMDVAFVDNKNATYSLSKCFWLKDKSYSYKQTIVSELEKEEFKPISQDYLEALASQLIIGQYDTKNITLQDIVAHAEKNKELILSQKQASLKNKLRNVAMLHTILFNKKKYAKQCFAHDMSDESQEAFWNTINS